MGLASLVLHGEVRHLLTYLSSRVQFLIEFLAIVGVLGFIREHLILWTLLRSDIAVEVQHHQWPPEAILVVGEYLSVGFLQGIEEYLLVGSQVLVGFCASQFSHLCGVFLGVCLAIRLLIVGVFLFESVVEHIHGITHGGERLQLVGEGRARNFHLGISV